MYALERLTAPKPEWETAVIYIKGTQPFVVEKKDQGNIEWKRKEQMLVIHQRGIDDPFNPPAPPQELPNGRVIPGFPGCTCDLQDFIHEDEIVRVSFFNNSKARQNVDMPNTPKILTAQGENQETAREYAEGKASMNIVQ